MASATSRGRGRRALARERSKVGCGGGVIDLLEVQADVVQVVDETDVLPVRVHPEPPALDLDHVPDQAEQRQPGRRHGPLP